MNFPTFIYHFSKQYKALADSLLLSPASHPTCLLKKAIKKSIWQNAACIAGIQHCKMAPGPASHSPQFPVDFVGLPKVAVPLGFKGKCICTTFSLPSSLYPQEVLSSVKMSKNASLLHLRVCLCGYNIFPLRSQHMKSHP